MHLLVHAVFTYVTVFRADWPDMYVSVSKPRYVGKNLLAVDSQQTHVAASYKGSPYKLPIGLTAAYEVRRSKYEHGDSLLGRLRPSMSFAIPPSRCDAFAWGLNCLAHDGQKWRCTAVAAARKVCPAARSSFPFAPVASVSGIWWAKVQVWTNHLPSPKYFFKSV